MGGTRHAIEWVVLAAGASGVLAACGLSKTGIISGDASVARPDTGPPIHDAGVDVTTPTPDATMPPQDAGHDTAPPPVDTGVDVGVDTGPMVCTATCPIGTACDGGALCGTLVCTSGACAPCSPACEPGAVCADNGDCASGVCSTTSKVCVDEVSCAAILAANSAAASGAYEINPGGGAFEVYCDMMTQQGGWTLVAKMGTTGSPGKFDYGSGYWTNGAVLSPTSTDMSQTEAMFPSYSTVGFQNILLEMTTVSGTAPAPNTLIVPLADPASLLHLISTPENSTSTATTLGVMAWTGLTNPQASIQNHCNSEGINRAPSPSGCADTNAGHIRIGLLANDGNDCCSPDSYVGFGGGYEDNSCNMVSLSAGSMAGNGCGGGSANIQDFGYIFVR
jgi:Fibrinogen beta and gamma chains, C-terminal globular domain